MKTTKEFKLPNKWCVRGDRQEVIDYSNIHGILKPYSMSDAHYHHYPPFNIGLMTGTTSYNVEKGYKEITFEQFKEYVLKEKMKDNTNWKITVNGRKMKDKEQEYELVDFKIKDLKEGDILENSSETLDIQGVFGKMVLSISTEGYVRQYTIKRLQNSDFKLQITKPKLEKIQGFEVREYPELPLVEVSNSEDFRSENSLVVELKKVRVDDFGYFVSRTGGSWKYCRPVPLERRNFIDI